MRRRRLRKVLVIVLAACLGLAGLGYGGYRGYRLLRQARYLKLARHYLAKSDAKWALYNLQRAVRADPFNVEAWRLMADVSDSTRSRTALLARSRVVELRPHSTDDRLALASTALLLGDYLAATNAIAGIDAAARDTAAYHNVAGAVALAGRQNAAAESHFLEAVRLQPSNPVPQLNLAVVRLQGTNAGAVQDARACLKGLSTAGTNGLLRCQALRELILDAARNQHLETALALASDLGQDTNSVFKDQLLRLDLLRATQDPALGAALAALQRDAANAPAKTHDLALWLMSNNRSQEAIDWLQTLPQTQKTNQPAAFLIAQCRTLLGDWAGLQASLSPQYWAELDLMRHAFLSRALREQGLADASKTEWESALQCARTGKRSARFDKPGLMMLLRVATQWDWTAEEENLLWDLIRQFPGDQWAFHGLVQRLFLAGQTRPLMLLYSDRVKRFPADLASKNNLAVLALLLNAQEHQPDQLARQVYDKDPANPAFASTYAFSLSLQHKTAQALSVFERLKPQELEDPSIAAYYGIILRASGNRAKAKRFLELGAKTRLLPEERRLIDKED